MFKTKAMILITAFWVLILCQGCAHNQDQAADGGKPAALSGGDPNRAQAEPAPDPSPKAAPEAATKAKARGQKTPSAGYKPGLVGELIDEDELAEGAPARIADPLELVNRAMFTFNDELFRVVVDPVVSGYNTVIPVEYRSAVRNFFHNLYTPVRFVAAILQGNIDTAGQELARFVINSTVGVLGFADAAGELMEIHAPADEDLGQTLGSWGIGQGFYIVYPFLGPSSLRDTAAFAGDLVLYPLWDMAPFYTALGIRTYQYLNDASFTIDDYWTLRRGALDPYVALRDAYAQLRERDVKR